ncbi:hypothetical protein Ndes2437A_g05190 [Nannochloris sp. 'desiccata']
MSSCDQEDVTDSRCIHCWSGPRCVSTSLMYSFAQRKDASLVLDEPLYAHYLRLNPSIPRPYRNLVLEQQDSDGDAVLVKNLQVLKEISATIGSKEDPPLIYLKHMAKHRAGINKDLLLHGRHVLLVRSPEAVISSFSEVLEPTLQETCYVALLELYSELRSMGKTPPVILSEDLVAAPEVTLRMLCSELKIEFDPGMLTWPAGPKPEIDGCWAPWWYAGTHASTGFGSSQHSDIDNGQKHGCCHNDAAHGGDSDGGVKLYDIEPSLRPLLEECRPIYEFLRRKALRPSHNISLSSSHVSSLPSSTGTHAHAADPRNENILIGIRDGFNNRFDLVWRPDAKISVLDSGFMLGDGVWEGIRVHKGVLLFIEEHLDRLYEGAKALDMDIGLTQLQLESLIYRTLDANGMGRENTNTSSTITKSTTATTTSNEGIHIRLMVTRGLKSTPYQHPNVTIGLPTVVIIPEYKHMDPMNGPKKKGIALFTSCIRRGNPDVQDPNWNSHSKLNCIAACIQASKAGADEALMLDPRGFVATCNSTNFFIVRKGERAPSSSSSSSFLPEVWAPTGSYQLRGITRAKVIELCRKNGIAVRECDFSLTQVYSADEAFVTGTFAGQIPVREVDGRKICICSSTSGDFVPGPVTERLQRLYAELCEQEAAKGRKERVSIYTK